MRKDPHVLPNPSAAQCRAAVKSARAAIAKIAALRTRAGNLVTPHDFERHKAVAQVVTFEIAPLIGAGLLDRAQVDPRLNRAVGRRGAATLENAVLSRALTRLGRRARGLA